MTFTPPIGLRGFKGPRLIGMKEFNKADKYDEHFLWNYGGKNRPIAIRYTFDKTGNTKAAYLVSPVARVKIDLKENGYPRSIFLVGHKDAGQGELYSQPLVVKADFEEGCITNAQRFYLDDPQKGSGHGSWYTTNVEQFDKRSQFELKMLETHLQAYFEVAKLSVPEIKRRYTS